MDRTYLEGRKSFLSDIRAKMDEGLYDDAITLAEERLKLFPGDMDACLAIASCQSEMDRPVEAGEVVEQWHDIMREQSRVYEVLGDAYNRKEMTKEAIDAYMRFAALNTDPLASGRVSEKIASLQGISTKDEDGDADMPTDFHTVTLARLYAKQGHFKMAGDVLDRILESDPGNVEAVKYAKHVRRLMEKGWGPVIDELERWLNGLQKKRGQ
ncbi:MAG: hypothetical protein JRD69_00455 [Deltaproteobacteria bacterium]|nr:hypothetical protein [Deltaproteobacteria bacterium]